MHSTSAVHVRPEVILDPGHGGHRAAGSSSAYGVCTAAGADEKSINLELARRVAGHVGPSALLTRVGDHNLPLRERARAAGRLGARALVSIHANGGSPGTHGSEVWVHDHYGADSISLAEHIHRELRSVGPTRGMYQAPLAVLDPRLVGSAAACLVEADYLTDAAGYRRLTEPAQLDAMAYAIAAGIKAYLRQPQLVRGASMPFVGASGSPYGSAGRWGDASAATIQGIDVSHHQGKIDWSKVAQDKKDVQFAILKISQGGWKPRLYDNDDKVVRKWAEAAKAEGILVSYYHYAMPDKKPSVQDDARDEADYFLYKCSELGVPPPDLALALDFEESRKKTGLDRAEMTEWAKVFMDYIAEKTSVVPLFYSYPSLLKHDVDAKQLRGYPLWLAGSKASNFPAAPDGWDRWHIWQYSTSGSVAGVSSSKVDLNKARPADLEEIKFQHTLDFSAVRDANRSGPLAYGGRRVSAAVGAYGKQVAPMSKFFPMSTDDKFLVEYDSIINPDIGTGEVLDRTKNTLKLKILIPDQTIFGQRIYKTDLKVVLSYQTFGKGNWARIWVNGQDLEFDDAVMREEDGGLKIFVEIPFGGFRSRRIKLTKTGSDVCEVEFLMRNGRTDTLILSKE